MFIYRRYEQSPEITGGPELEPEVNDNSEGDWSKSKCQVDQPKSSLNVRMELGSSLELAGRGRDSRRWKVNTERMLRLGMNIYNQTEVQESIYSVL
jgi:hypothetical protein